MEDFLIFSSYQELLELGVSAIFCKQEILINFSLPRPSNTFSYRIFAWIPSTTIVGYKKHLTHNSEFVHSALHN